MSFSRNMVFCIFLTLLLSSCATQRKDEAVFKLPDIPAYPEAQIKIPEKERLLCVVGYVAPVSFGEEESLALLKKRLKTLVPAEKAELAEINKKIAILEKNENEINEMRQIAKAVEDEMRSCGYNIIEPYVPAKSLTGEYIKKMLDVNKAYCNEGAGINTNAGQGGMSSFIVTTQSINSANNANPRQDEYTLANVFSDIEDNVIINDYKFGYNDRIKADRLITVQFLDKREAVGSKNYFLDIKCRIDVSDAKDSGKIGSIEVWGRYLPGVAKKPGTSVIIFGTPFVEAGKDMARNLLTIPDFKELVAGKKQ